MIVLHAFDESTREGMEAHLENWFGFPEAGPQWDRLDPAVVCYCGARIFPLERSRFDASDVSVAAVWHYGEWSGEQ